MPSVLQPLLKGIVLGTILSTSRKCIFRQMLQGSCVFGQYPNHTPYLLELDERVIHYYFQETQ
jgi:hypothetical protein